jgi:hypothetical protein
MKISGSLSLLLLVASFAIAAPAMAEPTVLCQANEESCSPENTYPSKSTTLKGNAGWEGTWARFEVGGSTVVSCPQGKFGLRVGDTEGPLVGEVEKWWLLSCEPVGCSAEAIPSEPPIGFPAEVEATGEGNGVVRVTEPRLLVKCGKLPFVLGCTYSMETMELSVEGGGEGEGEHAYIESSATLTLQSGLGCAGSVEYSSRHEVDEPGSAVYVTN